MKTLIIPIAGESVRFNGVRPKFLLTHPSGHLMLTEAIKGMNPEQYNDILIIALKEHEEKYHFTNALLTELKQNFSSFQEIKTIGDKTKITPNYKKIKLVLIDSSKNQPDTIYKGIKKSANVKGQITIKDCDNQFNLKVMEGNSVAVCDINETTTPANKSYVQIGESNSIVNIVEKQVISNQFCCGAYSFKNVDEFMTTYEQLQNNENLYVSHIIYKMILDGKMFFTEKATNYEDWGTLEAWLKYKSQFKTLFIDLDGVLVENSGKHFTPKWGTTKAIQKNVDVINDLYNSGKVTVIITTARDYDFEEQTLNQLGMLGIRYHRVLMGLPHSQRILINDFLTTNPYPSAVAINLVRNNAILDQLL